MPEQSNLSSAVRNEMHVDTPLVTIIVPVYNQEQFVTSCLDSIIATQYPCLEIIVTNDASRDNSNIVIQQWISEHNDDRVIYINHQRNIGLTKTLNEVIKCASGDMICLIAGDDIMLPNGIIDRVQYLIRRKDKLAVFSDCQVIDESGQLLYTSGIEGFFNKAGMYKKYLQIDALMPFTIIWNWAVPGPVFMCKKMLFDVVGPYDEELLVEDWDMYIRAAVAGKLGFCDSYVAKYRIHQNSMVRNNRRLGSNRLGQSLIKTAQKNLHITTGLLRLQLYTILISNAYDSEKQPFRKILLWCAHKLLLALTNRTFLLFRKLVYMKHTVQWRLPNRSC